MFRPHVKSDVKLCTHYLELLCQHEPNSVMDFVKSNDALHLTKSITVRNITIICDLFYLNFIL